MPARQRLDGMDGAIDRPDLRLIMQFQGIIGDRAAQRRAQDQPLLGEPVHVGAEETIGGTARPLGLVHGRIGLLYQSIDVGRVVRIEADAHAGGHRHLSGSDLERHHQSVGDPRGDERGLGCVTVRQDDHEFVAAQTPQHVTRLDLRAQALGELDQQFVTGRMPERIVDVLEIVDIEKRQRDMLAGRTALDRLGDQIPQVRSVRQAGQHVVISKPRDLGPCFLALDRNRPEMHAGIDDALMPAARAHDIP